jgi:hypothetical protein
MSNRVKLRKPLTEEGKRYQDRIKKHWMEGKFDKSISYVVDDNGYPIIQGVPVKV